MESDPMDPVESADPRMSIAAARLSRRGFLASGLAVGGASLLGACTGGSKGGGGKSGGGASDPSHERVLKHKAQNVLQIGVASSPTTLDTLDSDDEVSRWINEPIVESLYTYDDNLSSVPLLADGDPVISEDQLTWTLKLKPGVTWHNGDPFTAQDVSATMDYIANLMNGSEWVTVTLGFIQSWHVVDDLTIQLKMVQPYGLFRTFLTNIPMGHNGFTSKKDTMMGTGPFKLDHYEPGRSFTMSAFPGYHGTKPALAGIQYTVFQDDATRLVSLQQGTVDMITNVPYTNLKRATSDKNLVIYEKRSPLDIMWYINFDREPFNDINFRTALAYAMDRQGIVDRIFGGAATIGQGPIGPGEQGYQESLTRYGPHADIAKAKDYLSRATTQKRSFTITIPTEQIDQDIATVLIQGWKQIGVTADIKAMPGEPFSTALTNIDFDLLIATYQSGFSRGPANGTLDSADNTNVVPLGYKNPRITQLVATENQTMDDNVRTQALQEMNKILLDDAVMFPPAYPKTIIGTRKEITPMDTSLLAISRISPQKLAFR